MGRSQKSIKSDSLPEILQSSAKTLRDNGRLIDFTIIVDGTKFDAHKLILAASSDFFSTMLEHDSIESQTDQCQLHSVTPAVMEKVLEFCYTSQIRLDIESVQDILVGASILQINTLESLCVDYIVDRIDTTNCSSFLTLADRCNLPRLMEKVMNFCLEKFEIISEEKEFLQLDSNLMSKLISHDRLSVSNEEKVLNAVNKWVAADKHRVHELDILAAHIRFPLMSAHSLIVLSRDDQIQQSKQLQILIREAKDYHLLEAFPEEGLRSQMIGKRFEHRYSSALRRQQGIFAVGGWAKVSGYIDAAERYDPSLDKWIAINKMTKPRYDMGVSILDDCLYVVGGQDGKSYLRSVDCYNIKEDVWRSDVPGMKYSRTGVGVCTWSGHIYAIGGRVNENSLNVVERYNPRTNKWEECPRLRKQRDRPGVTVCNDSIYVLGGGHKFSDTSTLAINTVERFNVSKDEWTVAAPMITSRKNFGCTTFEGKIYAVGGEDDSRKLLNTAECYDPAEGQWTPIPPMSAKRRGIGLVGMDGILYAVGGHNRGSLNLVEAYDPVKKEWTTKSPMINARFGGGLALYSPMKQDRP